MIISLNRKTMIPKEQLIRKYAKLMKQCKQIESIHHDRLKNEITTVQKEYVNSIAFSIEVMNNSI